MKLRNIEHCTCVAYHIYRTPKSFQVSGSKVSEKMLSLSAEVADQKRQSRMEKVCECDVSRFTTITY